VNDFLAKTRLGSHFPSELKQIYAFLVICSAEVSSKLFLACGESCTSIS